MPRPCSSESAFDFEETGDAELLSLLASRDNLVNCFQEEYLATPDYSYDREGGAKRQRTSSPIGRDAAHEDKAQPTAQSGHDHKYQRAFAACTNCRLRRSRCDGFGLDRSCSRCVRANSKCIFLPGRRSAVRARSNEAPNTEQTIKKNPTKRARCHSPNQAADESEVSFTLCANSEASSNNQLGFPMPLRSNARTDSTTRPRINSHNLDEDDLREMKICFRRIVYWELPVVNVEQLQKCLLFKSTGGIDPNELLLNAILLTIIPHLSAKALKHLGYGCSEAATKAKLAIVTALYPILEDTEPVTALAAMLLCAHRCRRDNRTHQANQGVQKCVTLCIRTSLDQFPKGSALAKLDPAHRTLWKRLWWSTMLLDWQLAMLTGREPYIRSGCWDVPLPTIQDLYAVEDGAPHKSDSTYQLACGFCEQVETMVENVRCHEVTDYDLRATSSPESNTDDEADLIRYIYNRMPESSLHSSMDPGHRQEQKYLTEHELIEHIEAQVRQGIDWELGLENYGTTWT